MTRRQRLHQETIHEIKTTARHQMAQNGSAGVSLSAVAREMGITQPALYRYFAGRDDLITALIADAFNDLADALEQAAQGIPSDAYGRRMFAVLMAYRAWALAHPVDFSLIYGSPIPGYHAPSEVTQPPAQRGFAVILAILGEAHAAGVLRPLPEHLSLPLGLSAALPAPAGPASPPVDPLVLYIGLVGWYHIHGMLMLELYEHNTTLLSDMRLFYRHEAAALLCSLGLEVDEGDPAASTD